MIDKTADLFFTILTTENEPVELLTDGYGMALAVKNLSVSNGDKIDAGFVSIKIEDGSAGTVSLQVSMLSASTQLCNLMNSIKHIWQS